MLVDGLDAQIGLFLLHSPQPGGANIAELKQKALAGFDEEAFFDDLTEIERAIFQEGKRHIAFDRLCPNDRSPGRLPESRGNDHLRAQNARRAFALVTAESPASWENGVNPRIFG